MEAGSPLQPDDALRDTAVRRLRKKRDFGIHALVYLLVNGFLVVIWAVTSGDFFWPIFPILGWGIGVAGNAWEVFVRKPITDAEVDREEKRLRGDAPG